ncbi:glycosyltransferase family 2 protein [Nocardioides aestuarii]|uniref:Glycosyltransferase family 2 protein n=1 Tax=Nocardioides aestuarii TaxID=252231 RepID=A0ABW4TK69_9ACTN
MTLNREDFLYSIVIPVYNSEQIVGDTVERVVDVFTQAGLRFELILVNDGSPDDSWSVISERASRHEQVVALDLMRNYGQHYANLAGLTEARGDYVITMDDDLQNPPDQALLLIDAAMAGHEVVFGQFEQKQAAGFRVLGTKVIGMMNNRIFGKPVDLTVSNFRILRRDVVDRIVAHRTSFPYITGQALMFSGDRANVLVRHDPRPVGKSTYSLSRIARLVLTILFSYSSWPLRAAAVLGFAISGLSFLLGAYLVVRALVLDTVFPGWTSIMVLLSLFAGFIIALLSMIGEYVVRTLQTVSTGDNFHVTRRVGR